MKQRLRGKKGTRRKPPKEPMIPEEAAKRGNDKRAALSRPLRYPPESAYREKRTIVDLTNTNYQAPMASKTAADLTHAERLIALARESNPAKRKAKAEEYIGIVQNDLLELIEQRDSAARRMGEPPSAPPDLVALARGTTPAENRTDADGTTSWAVLADRYKTDERSPYHNVRYATKHYYDGLMRVLTEERGDEHLSDVNAADLENIYQAWTETGALSMAHAKLTMLRMLVNFGAAILKDPECERLAVPLHRMRSIGVNSRIPRPVTKEDILTEEQAKAIIAKAHELGFPSIAMAQAFQFGCKLRQKDVVGEWIPVSQPGVSAFIDSDSNQKWMPGLIWDRIDADLVLRHIVSRTRKNVTIDLRSIPIVRSEIERQGRKTSGPVVISEWNDLPYRTFSFRRKWREVADAVGIPKNIKNMDSRIGGDEKEESEQERIRPVRS